MRERSKPMVPAPSEDFDGSIGVAEAAVLLQNPKSMVSSVDPLLHLELGLLLLGGLI